MQRKSNSNQSQAESATDYISHPDLLISGTTKKVPRTRVRKKTSEKTGDSSSQESHSLPKNRKKSEKETLESTAAQDSLEAKNNLEETLPLIFRKPKERPVAVDKSDIKSGISQDALSVRFRDRSKGRGSLVTGFENREGSLLQQEPPDNQRTPQTHEGYDESIKLNWRPFQSSPNAKLTQRNSNQTTRSAKVSLQNSEPKPRIDFEISEIDFPFQFRSRNQTHLQEPVSLIQVENGLDSHSIAQASVPKPRPTITPPEEAVQIINLNGVPTIVKNHEAFAPFFFALGQLTGKTFDVAGEEINLAFEAGIRLFQFELPVELSNSGIEHALEEYKVAISKLQEWAPSTKFGIKLRLQPPRYWESDFPEAKQYGAGLEQTPSLSSNAYWDFAVELISQLIQELVKINGPKELTHIHLGKELWLRQESAGYDTSISAQFQFKEWCKARYMNDEITLKAAWFDSSANFETLVIPEFQRQSANSEQFVRTSRKDRRHVDYHLFLSDMTVSRIGDLAYEIKKASQGQLLVAVGYGYCLELSYPHSGQLALGKLLRDPHIDIITGALSYRNRQPGGAATFPCPIDSIALNGKLFLLEEDHKTSLSGRIDDDDLNPVIKTPQALESVQWRGAGASLAHSAGVMWCDTFSLGWLKTPGIWRRATEIHQKFYQRMATKAKDPEAIVFVDERALAYLVDPNAFTLMIQNVCESALRSGLQVGFYLLSDLAHRERFPEGKLYLFLNAWDVRTELRSAIKNRLQKDKKVLFWLYSAALMDSGRESLERTREVMGIAIKPQPFHSKSGTSLVNKRHPLATAFPDRGVIGGSKLEPSYFAIYDESQEVLGQYLQTGLSSFVVKTVNLQEQPSDYWTSVFLGEPIVSPALIRALGQMADAHVYDLHEDTIHVSPPFFTSHSRVGGAKTLPLPSNWSVYDAINKRFENVEANSHKRMTFDSSTQMYFIGTREEIETISETEPQQVARVEEYPVRDQNTRSNGGLDLDVPLLRLADWIGISDGEESTEEWLLRPTVAEFEIVDGSNDELEPQPSLYAQGSRRFRRGRKGRDRTSSSTPDVVDSDTGMSIMFRKR